MLVAKRTFQLDDIYQKEHYYGIGDEFIIMDICNHKNHVDFGLNSWDGIFRWSIDYDKFEDLTKYLIHKKNFKKYIRQKKLKQLKSYKNGSE